MSGEPNRDQSIDRLLRRTLRGAAAPAPGGCLDAETLAAWADRALPADEAAHVERHLSDCVRCQAMLAVFARTAPPTPVSADRPHWLRWMLPIAAGSVAAAALIWILWPVAPNPPVNRAARAEQPAVSPLQPRGAPAPATPAEAPASPAKLSEARRPSPPRSDSIDAVSPTKAKSLPQAAQGQRETVTAAEPAPAPIAAPPAPTPASREASAGDSAQLQALRDIRADQPKAAETVVVSEFVGRRILAPAARPVAVGGEGRGGGVTAGAAGGISSASAAAQPSAGPVRWRIHASGRVERSVSGGASWEAIPIEPPTFITAGDAPGPSICWLVGRGGVVLRSVDGLHFERLSVPDPADLASVRASDAAHADVTTVDGRVLTTADGGLSWRK